MYGVASDGFVGSVRVLHSDGWEGAFYSYRFPHLRTALKSRTLLNIFIMIKILRYHQRAVRWQLSYF